eukprot:14907-Chlamydomonas_euryale.AAC.2
MAHDDHRPNRPVGHELPVPVVRFEPVVGPLRRAAAARPLPCRALHRLGIGAAGGAAAARPLVRGLRAWVRWRRCRRLQLHLSGR